MTIETTIGVIGLGVMGGAIARRLIQRGRKMIVFDTNPDRIAPLLNERVVAASAVADLADRVDLAMNLRTPMPLTNLIADLHRMLVAGGHGAEDSVAYMSLFDMGRAARNQDPSP